MPALEAGDASPSRRAGSSSRTPPSASRPRRGRRPPTRSARGRAPRSGAPSRRGGPSPAPVLRPSPLERNRRAVYRSAHNRHIRVTHASRPHDYARRGEEVRGTSAGATARGRRCRPSRRTELRSRPDRLRHRAKELDAQLEIVDRDPLVRGVDQPRRDLRAHRPQREEPVRDRAERLAQPVRVGEAGDADRGQPRARLEPGRRTPRSPTRAASRAASACRPARRATPARSRPPRASRGSSASASASVWPGSSRQSTITSQRPGITFRFCDASIIVGATVIPSSGSIISAATGSTARAIGERLLRGRHRVGDRGEEPLRLRRQLRAPAANSPSRSTSRAALTSALSAIAGIDAVAAPARARRARTASSASRRTSRDRERGRRARPGRPRPR